MYMKNCDLIIPETGGVILVSPDPFDKDITRAEFYLDSHTLMLIDIDDDSEMVEHAITDDAAINALVSNSTIVIAHVDNGAPQSGFEVPLISVRP